MRTLVTGATGLVGNNVVRLLLDRGEQVRVLVRAQSDPRTLAGLSVEQAIGDVTDRQSVLAASQGVQRVIHSAAYVRIGSSHPELYRQINVEGTRHVAEAALQVGARMVHVSSVDALGYGKHGTLATEDTPPDPRVRVPYVVTKRAAEAVVLEAVSRGLDARIVNPVFMLGPWDWKPSSGKLLLYVAKHGLWIAPWGGNDFCDVRDVAAGILAAMQHGSTGRRYILGGEPLSYLAALRMFAAIGGRRGPLVRLGPLAVYGSGAAGSIWGWLRGREPDHNLAAARMISQNHHFSYARATAELGYSPRPVQQAAEAAWQWFQEHGYA